jgi:hypothetical protein
MASFVVMPSSEGRHDRRILSTIKRRGASCECSNSRAVLRSECRKPVGKNCLGVRKRQLAADGREAGQHPANSGHSSRTPSKRILNVRRHGGLGSMALATHTSNGAVRRGSPLDRRNHHHHSQLLANMVRLDGSAGQCLALCRLNFTDAVGCCGSPLVRKPTPNWAARYLPFNTGSVGSISVARPSPPRRIMFG